MDILQKKLVYVDDLSITPIDEGYMLESESQDKFCILNEDAYKLVSQVDGNTKTMDICKNTLDQNATEEFFTQMIDLGLINVVE